jgi:hypothetical protein
MKLLLISLLIFYSNFSLAEDYTSLRIGQSLSFHPALGEGSERFENKLSDDGKLVQNHKLTLNFNKKMGMGYNRTTILLAKDCVDSPVLGFGKSWGSESHYGSQFGFILGGYFMDRQPWEERLIAQFWINVNDNIGFVPIIGIEYNHVLIKGEKTNLVFENFFSPLLTNHALMIEVRF